ncbi:MAG: sulfatase [Thermoguttaceae bacterium]|jgi:arylsulfatase A-like enzyme|nr:sulfatase [Thermoguttaceae bacterium]
MFRQRPWISALAAFGLLVVWPAGAGIAAAGRLPNVVIVFADDLGYADLGVYGAEDITTPHLDRMAAEGVRFTDFYVPVSICTPSRAALLTGCYPPRVSAVRVLFPRDHTGLNPGEYTMSRMFKDRGYATACVGKWHLGHLPEFLPMKHGFDTYYGIPYSNDMDNVSGKSHRDANYPDPKVEYFNVPLMRNEEIIERPADQTTITRRYTEEAVRFIRENKETPFFLYVAHTMPHVPLFAGERFRGKSRGGLYGDVIEEIDWSVGEVLAALKELGLDDRTLVIFTSDNGPWRAFGDHGGSAKPLRGGKFTTYEGGVRMPAIARWPGVVPAGTVCREPAMTIDLLPTLASLISVELPADRSVDGRDIWPLIVGEPEARSPHEAYFFTQGEHVQAVRRGPWKMRLEPLELYNLADDLSESRNVAGDHPEIVESLRALAAQLQDDLRENARPMGRAAR